ncbi:MAG: hypothetical protein JWR54_3464 [Mucilaginibacter sp.]|jgi:hypothetical protein|nr:hypothetical protein [Mucilaginibacter sp.]
MIFGLTHLLMVVCIGSIIYTVVDFENHDVSREVTFKPTYFSFFRNDTKPFKIRLFTFFLEIISKVNSLLLMLL